MSSSELKFLLAVPTQIDLKTTDVEILVALFQQIVAKLTA